LKEHAAVCTAYYPPTPDVFAFCFCAEQGVYVEVLPLLLFAVVSFTAGLLSLQLPETLGAKLADTVEELKNL
jgi:hypothetical protein